MPHNIWSIVTPKVWISALESATAKSLPPSPSVAPLDSSSDNNSSALFGHGMINIVHSITDDYQTDDYNTTG